MKKETLTLITLALIQFTNIMDFMVMMPLSGQLMDVFHISPKQFGFLVSSYTISAGIFGFLGAFYIDKFDRKKILIATYCGFIIGTFSCALAPTYHLLLLARFLTGMFGGMLSAIVLSIIGDAFPFEKRATAMGTVMAGFSLAAVLGVPFGNYVAAEYNWHIPFFIVGFSGIGILILIALYIPSMTKHFTKDDVPSNPFSVITNITSNANQLRALLLMFLLMIGQFSVIPFITPYMMSNVGFTQHQITYIYLFGGLATIFSSRLVGKLADKHGKQKIFMVFILISLIPLFGISNMPKIAIPYVLCVTTLFFISVTGRMIPATTMITSTVVPQHRGGFMSINSSVQQLSAGIAALMGGAIVTKSSSGLLLNYNYVGLIAMTASMLAIFVAKKIIAVDENTHQVTQSKVLLENENSNS